jgi:hypothetical protein
MILISRKYYGAWGWELGPQVREIVGFVTGGGGGGVWYQLGKKRGAKRGVFLYPCLIKPGNAMPAK